MVGVGDSAGVTVAVGSGVLVIVGVSEGERVAVGVAVGLANPGNAQLESKVITLARMNTINKRIFARFFIVIFISITSSKN